MIENILDENENAVEIATSETQETEISNQVIQEYIDSIRSQAESTIRKPYEDDYVELFTTGFLKIPVEEFYDSAYINGPAIICKYAEIRHCAFIRGKAIVGEGAVVGNSTELKNVILFGRSEESKFILSLYI